MSPDHATMVAVALIAWVALMWIGLAIECRFRSRQRSRLGPAETPATAAKTIEVGAASPRPAFPSSR